MKKILDWNKYLDTAAETVAEGIVMLENNNEASSRREQLCSSFRKDPAPLL